MNIGRKNQMLVAITYHYVRPDYSDCGRGIQGVTTKAFEKQLDILSRKGTFASAREVLGAARGEGSLPSRGLLVTFDDGLREQYDFAWEILKRKGIPAIFFVNTRPIAEQIVCSVHKVHLMRAALTASAFEEVLRESAKTLRIALNCNASEEVCRKRYPYDTAEAAKVKYLINFGLPRAKRASLIDDAFERVFRGCEAAISRDFYMTPDQVKNLSGAGCIGSHLHDHLPLTVLSGASQKEMVSKSIDQIVEWSGITPRVLSYPFGICDPGSTKMANMLRRCGIEVGFTVDPSVNGNGHFENPLFLNRYDCNLLPGGKRPVMEADTMFEPAPVSEADSTIGVGGLAPCPVSS